MFQGDLSLLAKGGWKFDVSKVDSVTAISQALSLQETAFSLTTSAQSTVDEYGTIAYDRRGNDSVALDSAGLGKHRAAA